jgi:N-acyl-D-aspartate/D-glutamate deacylase
MQRKEPHMLDLIITDGLIADGTGKAQFRADVGVAGDRIVEVGEVRSAAKRRINAGGLLVTPGFIDIHTHFDGQVSWDSELAPSSINGVTSVAMGNCGVGFAPARADKHQWLINLLEGVEDIPGTALAEGLTWDWESFPEYLDALARREFTMDVGGYLPHAALRTYVMGDRGADHMQHPADSEIDEMQRLTREALHAGALGFSTSRTMAHISRDGNNIGTLKATERELCGIVQALEQTDRGAIQLISDAYLSADEDFAVAELRLIRALAEISGRPLSFTVMQTNNVPRRWRMLLDAAVPMAAAGLTVRAQVAPRPIGAVMSFSSTVNPFMGTQTYLELLPLPTDSRLARLREPGVKLRIVAEFRDQKLSDLQKLNPWNLRQMFRMGDPVNYEPTPDESLQAEAERAGREPTEYAYDVLLEDFGRRVIYAPVINYAEGNLDVVYEMLTDPNALFGLSDSGAHVQTIVDGTFPTTTLALWSRGTRDGRCIPTEILINGYTQRNAVQVGWMDRGVIAPGYLADLNIIDLDRLQVSPPRLINDLPAGGSRFLQVTQGYAYTIKRGRVTLADGRFTGELPGRLMRGAQPAP